MNEKKFSFTGNTPLLLHIGIAEFVVDSSHQSLNQKMDINCYDFKNDKMMDKVLNV